MSGVWTACLLVAGALTVAWPGAGAGLVRRRGPWLRRSILQRRAVPARVFPVAVVVAGAGALLVGGPVAAVVVAVYGALGFRAARRRAAGRGAAAVRAATLDDLAALAADLRAGLPPAAADGGAVAAGLSAVDGGAVPAGLSAVDGRPGRAGLSPADWGSGPAVIGTEPVPAGGRAERAAGGAGPADRLVRLTASVWRLAERTGAPAADLIERIEADARAADRASATATAQAAGARATAFLLAALPLGGIGIGIMIGADPVDVLLHTPLGAACALVALLLQCCGLLWADRLASGATR